MHFDADNWLSMGKWVTSPPTASVPYSNRMRFVPSIMQVVAQVTVHGLYKMKIIKNKNTHLVLSHYSENFLFRDF